MPWIQDSAPERNEILNIGVGAGGWGIDKIILSSAWDTWSPKQI